KKKNNANNVNEDEIKGEISKTKQQKTIIKRFYEFDALEKGSRYLALQASQWILSVK
ncbi:MAG: ATP phosphoribosyltransferase regulatory subunit, partial [Hydrogenovibrio crunogenus]|nr:ATP phosphoribosyltransferase regulatory subunit [Hydrogenovibrio crunogenus]